MPAQIILSEDEQPNLAPEVTQSCQAPSGASFKNVANQNLDPKCFDFDWANEVEEEIFGNPPSNLQKEASLTKGSYVPFVRGSAGPFPQFSIYEADKRYEYEEENPTNLDTRPRRIINTGSVESQKPQVKNPTNTQPEKKTRKRWKKHTNTNTPKIQPSWEYYESQALEDPFESLLPTVDRIVELAEPTPVVDNIWATYRRS